MDHVEWSVQHKEFLAARERDALRDGTVAPNDPQLERLQVQVESLKRDLKAAQRSERSSKRQHSAAATRHAKGTVGGGTTLWESNNRLEDHAMMIANCMCDFVVATFSALEAMRDEMRVTISNFRRHGPGAYPTDEALTHVFNHSGKAVAEVQKGLARVMPMFSTTVRHLEPLAILSEMRAAIDREAERPLECPPQEYLERWRRRAADHLRETVEPITRPELIVKRSTMCDKTPVALELLASPRTLLPRPPPRERERQRAVSAARPVGEIDAQRTALHRKYDVHQLSPRPRTERRDPKQPQAPPVHSKR